MSVEPMTVGPGRRSTPGGAARAPRRRGSATTGERRRSLLERDEVVADHRLEHLHLTVSGGIEMEDGIVGLRRPDQARQQGPGEG
jgi:hypothetical protein